MLTLAGRDQIDPRDHRLEHVAAEARRDEVIPGPVHERRPGRVVAHHLDIEVGPGPRFLTTGAGSVWTLNQGDGTISRVDAKTGKLIANIEAGIPGTGGELAFGAGHVWATVFQIPITEIDPAKNAVVKQWVGPGGDSIRVGHNSIWLSNLREQNVWRLKIDQP